MTLGGRLVGVLTRQRHVRALVLEVASRDAAFTLRSRAIADPFQF
jgi:hypothetical protein